MEEFDKLKHQCSNLVDLANTIVSNNSRLKHQNLSLLEENEQLKRKLDDASTRIDQMLLRYSEFYNEQEN